MSAISTDAEQWNKEHPTKLNVFGAFAFFLQKFAKCFFTKSGFLDAKGDFDEKVVIEKLTADGTDKAKVEAFVKTCKKDLGDNKEENPLKVYACYVKNKALWAFQW